MKWTETYHCTSFAHCKKCRDKMGGQAWRESVAKVYETDGINWECPYGAEWGHGQPRGIGECIARFAKWMGIRECGGCRRRRKVLNGATVATKRLMLYCFRTIRNALP